MIKSLKKNAWALLLMVLVMVLLLNTLPSYAKYISTTPSITVGWRHFGAALKSELYISAVSQDFMRINGLELKYEASDAETIQVTVTNPTAHRYYYTDLNTVVQEIVAEPIAGTAGVVVNEVTVYYVEAGSTITFDVSFPQKDQYMISFNFTLIPPTSEGGDDIGEMENAPGVVGNVLNMANYGLNMEVSGNVGFVNWCNSGKPVLYSTDNKVSGGQLATLIAEANASGLYFTLEYINSNQYNLYIYPSYSGNGYPGGDVLVYKQVLYREGEGSMWQTGESFKGYATLIRVKHAGTNYYHMPTTNSGKTVAWNQGEIPTP